MSDFPDEEPDPEMTEDHEENAPGLEEALEEIFENEDREELEGLMDPVDADVQLELEIEANERQMQQMQRADLQCTLSKVLLCLHPRSAFS